MHSRRGPERISGCAQCRGLHDNAEPTADRFIIANRRHADFDPYRKPAGSNFGFGHCL